MTNISQSRARQLRCALLVVLLGFVGRQNAVAGTGYIDATGKWHFTVLFVHPGTNLPSDTDTFWREVIKIADSDLCKATSGQHRFGTVSIDVAPNYDALADVIIWQGRDHSLADVYGIRGPSFHVFMSDLLRPPSPTQQDKEQLAKILVHELGHYLYSLYDEYVGQDNAPLVRPISRPYQCVYRDFKMNSLDKAACFMERVWPETGMPSPPPTIGTWCYSDNHEVDAPMHFTCDTWQSANNLAIKNCWETIKGKYRGFGATPSEPLLATDPTVVIACQPQNPFPFSARLRETELVVAIDASIAPGSVEENKLYEILDNIFQRAPNFPGKVVLISYNKESMMVSPVLDWRTVTSLRTSYRTEFASIRRAPVDGASLIRLMSEVSQQFDELSAGSGAISRTFLLITKGSEDSTTVPLPRDLAPLHESYHVRTSIAYVVNMGTLSSQIIDAHSRLAGGLRGFVYDATIRNVTNAAGIETAGKQIVCVQTKKYCTPGPHDDFSYTIPDSTKEILVTVSWPKSNPNCDVIVTIRRNGQGNRVVANSDTDFVGNALKSRRYFDLNAGEKIQVLIQISNACSPCFPVTFTISDERPEVFLSAGPERLIYGPNDNEVVRGRVTGPFPFINLNSFMAAEVDSFGEFRPTADTMAADAGVEAFGNNQVFNGDWVKGDGVYSQIIKSTGPGPLRTVRLRAINAGSAKLAAGESFSKRPGGPVPRFRREAFATYFVNAQHGKALFPSIQFNSSSPIKSKNDTVRVFGSYGLSLEYPNAHVLEGSLTVKNTGTGATTSVPMAFRANTFEAAFRASAPSALQLTAVLKVSYRTGDKRQDSTVKDFVVSVQERQQTTVPTTLRLYPSYPNPFNHSTRFRFDLPQRTKVLLAVYDVMGRKVRTLRRDEFLVAGEHEQEWDGQTDEGAIAVSGLYFVRLETVGELQIQKILLLK